MSPPKPPRVTGLRHFFAAARYSVAGLKRLLHEAAFRQELLACGAMALLLLVLNASPTELLVFFGLALLVICVEALNTALESIVDHLTQDWAEFARDAKDLGSLAVMCCLLCHGLLLLHVLVT